MKKRLFGILLSFALMLTMMPVLGLTQPAHATTDPALSITSPAVGQVIGNDGKNYDYSSLPQSVAAVAKIAYVDETNHKGLALAMTDESGTKDWNEADTAASAHTPAFTGGTWKLASKDEWENMINAAGGFASLRDGFSSVDGTNMIESFYWSSTPQGANEWYINFKSGAWYSDSKSRKYNVRACLTFDIVTTYPLWVGETQVNSANKDDVFGDGKVSYTPASDGNPAKLKLKNYTYNSDSGSNEEHSAIYANDKNLVIELEGTNSVDSTNVAGNKRAVNVASHQLTIQGSGTLNAKGEEVGIFASKGIIIKDCTVIARSTTTTTGEYTGGIFSGSEDYDITIKDATVKANSVVGNAIDSGRDVIIENSIVEAHSTNDTGIYSYRGNVEINAGSIVTASGGKQAIRDNVKNAIAGTGWENADGSGKKTDIAVGVHNITELVNFKKVQFPVMFTVTFVDGQGKTLGTDEVASGKAATAPADPTRDGYTFKGWDKDFSKVTEDMTVTALWEKKTDPTPATVTTAPAAKSLTADGTAQELVEAGTTKDGTMQYALGKDDKTPPATGWSTSIPKGTEAGDYYVWYKVVGDAAHSDSKPVCVKVTIAGKTDPAPSKAKPVAAVKGIAKGKTSLKFTWNKVEGAAKYEIWMSKCNTAKKKYSVKKVKKLGADKTTYTRKELRPNTAYKFRIVAKDASDKVISKSRICHAYTGNVKGSRMNVKKLKLSTKSFTLNKGDTAKIKATQTKARLGKKLCSHAKKLRYTSTNTSVANVDKSGKITAVGTGTCKIYVQTVNGIWKTVKVTVN